MSHEPPHDFLLYSANLGHQSRTIEISGDEHHHAARVLRLGPDDEVYVTNGRGIRARCRVKAIGRNLTRLDVLEQNEVVRPDPRITLALGCLRKPAFELAVKQCTELGMDRCIPFVSVKSPPNQYGPGFLERLDRVALSAMKQSFRTTLPAVEPAVSFDTLLERLRECGPVIVGDAEGGRIGPGPSTGTVGIVVGPAGGLTADENEALRKAGATFVSATRHRLRSETAAALLVGMVSDALRA